MSELIKCFVHAQLIFCSFSLLRNAGVTLLSSVSDSQTVGTVVPPQAVIFCMSITTATFAVVS